MNDGFPSLADGCILTQRRNHADTANGIGRILALQEVVDRIARAELFAKPPGKYEAANREAKGVIYLALVVLRWSEGGKGRVEEVVARLERGESCSVFPFSRFCVVGLWVVCGEMREMADGSGISQA